MPNVPGGHPYHVHGCGGRRGAYTPTPPAKHARHLPELSTDLWTRIFQLLKPAVIDLGDATSRLDNLASDICVFHSLQQVCKQFRDIFLSNCDWYALMCLPDRLGKSSSASLQQWSTRHKSKLVDLRILSPDGFSALTAITALSGTCSCPDNSLCFSSRDCLLSTYTALRTCSFSHIALYAFPGLNLGILQSLHHLNNLELKSGKIDTGYSYNLHLVRHLTMLVIECVDVSASENCYFASQLQCLDVKYGALRGVHADGIAACRQLRHLRCISSQVTAQANLDSLGTSGHFVNIPTAISRLDVLENLQLTVQPNTALPAPQEVDLRWLDNLTNLQKLSFLVRPGSTGKLSGNTSSLSRLKEWWVLFADHTLNLSSVDWQVYTSLQQVHFVGGVKLDARILHRMTGARALSELYVHMGAVGDKVKFEAHLSCAAKFVKLRMPWIKFHVDYIPQQSRLFTRSIASFVPFG